MHEIKRKKISDGIRISSGRTKKKKERKTRTRASSVIVPQKKPSQEVFIKQKVNKKRKISFLKHVFMSVMGFFIVHKKKLKWFLFGLVYISFLFVIFNYLNYTKVEVIPHQEEVNLSQKIKVFLNPEYKKLGVSIIAFSDSLSESVSATEEIDVEKKAEGFITIFNDYSSEPQRLAPETRFRSVSGKIFKLGKEGVVIPGKNGSEPGKVEVKVFAAESGPEYNIDITDFTIPGFEEMGLMDKYHKIYAISTKKFSGGFRGKQKVLKDSDKKNVLEKLEKELKNQLLKKLEQEKTDKTILVENTVQIFFKKPKVVREGGNQYLVEQEAQVFALLVEKKKLEQWMKSFLLKDVFGQDIRYEPIDYVTFSYEGETIDYQHFKSAEVNIYAKGKFIWSIDEDLLKKSLAGLAKNKVPLILKEFPEIEKSTIHIFPFWKKNISEYEEKIYIEVYNK